jgi:2-amino-4-hydroxy-6-hydroxymethyldihydropteridine diphosphokinase
VTGSVTAAANRSGHGTIWSAPAQPTSVAIGLGSNQGDRLDNLRRALFALLSHPEIRVRAVSPVYETEYVGPGRQPPYLNACAEVATRLAPHVLLAVLKGTEQRLGRPPGSHLQPRVIDLDILLYGDRVAGDTVLTLPHPGLATRAFVLAPLADIAPLRRLPDSGETVAAVCARILARGGPWVRVRAEHPLLPQEAGDGEEAWRASLAIHCR